MHTPYTHAQEAAHARRALCVVHLILSRRGSMASPMCAIGTVPRARVTYRRFIHLSSFIFYLLTRRADRAHATHGSLWASRDARTYNILNHPRVEGRTGELNSDVPQEHTQLRTDAQMAHRASTVAAAYMAGLADQVAERYPNTNRIGTTRATEQPSGCGPARLGQLRCTGPMAV